MTIDLLPSRRQMLQTAAAGEQGVAREAVIEESDYILDSILAFISIPAIAYFYRSPPYVIHSAQRYGV